MKQSYQITETIDEIEVTGEMTRPSGTRIEVEITVPYQELSDSLHLPSLARSRNLPADQIVGLAIKDLLQVLYRVGQFLEQNRESLRKELIDYKEKSDLPETNVEAQFLAKRRSLKAELSSGMITNDDYERRIAVAKFLRKYQSEQNDTAVDAFFEKHFPMELTPNLREQIMLELEP